MKFPADARHRYSPAQLAAAEWLVLRDNGLTPEQQKEFQHWLAVDPQHARAFEALDATWGSLDAVRELPQAGGQPDPDSLSPARVKAMFGPGRGRRILSWPRALAAAAAIAVAFVGWQYSSGSRPTSPDFTTAMATEIGGLRTMNLPDGSIVRLNTDSAAEVLFSAAERRIKLSRGEAHFSVAKDPARPFVVNAGGVTVVAVGTAFNVRMRPESVEVLVTEGKVHVADLVKGESLLAWPGDKGGDSAAPALLAAGEMALIRLVPAAPVPAAPVVVTHVEVERNLAWQERRLEFAAEALVDIVAEFNRYNRHKLVVADPRLAPLRFGGSFRADGYETLVHLLETNHGIVVERREAETLLSLP